MRTVMGPYPPPYGGAEICAEQDFKEMGELFIGTSGIPGRTPSRILIVKRPFIIDGPLLFWEVFKNRKRISQINAHFATTFGFVAYLGKKLFKIPYKVICHGSDVMINLKTPFYRFFTMRALKNADRIDVVSQSLKEILENIGLDTSKISVKLNTAGEDFKRIIRIRKKDQIIFVGNVKKKKGVDILIDAFARISSKFPKYHLLIVGKIEEKGYHRKLESMIRQKGLSGKVFFTGAQKHNRIPLLLNESKLFVLPSRSEGYGIALAEAFACGLPAVATNVGGIPEVRGGKLTLVDPESSEELAFAMENILIKVR